MKNVILTFWKDDSGQDLAEYAILLGLVTIALIAAIGLFSNAIGGLFEEAQTTLEAT